MWMNDYSAGSFDSRIRLLKEVCDEFLVFMGKNYFLFYSDINMDTE